MDLSPGSFVHPEGVSLACLADSFSPAYVLLAVRARVLLLLFAVWFQVGVPGVLAQGGASVTLSGVVADSVSGMPLEGATVFIAGSMMGTVANAEGRFTLSNVPEGAHRLYVSMLGYEPVRKELLIRRGDELTFSFRLKPTLVEIPEVVVSDRENRRWRKRLEKFERLFIGESPAAAFTEIENPYVLDFESPRWRLIARASAPLIITNRALGYRVRFFLKEFEARGTLVRYDGEPLFEPLEPANAEEAMRWKENRRRAFYGSFRHFMLSVLADSAHEAGFRTYGRHAIGFDHWSTEKYPMPAKYLLDGDRDAPEVELDFNGVVEIVYLNEPEDKSFPNWIAARRRADRVQTSWIELTDGPTAVDQAGEVVDPYGVTVYGYFAFERVADQLPKEYRPE